MGKTFGNLLTRLGTGISEIAGAVADDAIAIAGKVATKGSKIAAGVGTDAIATSYNVVKTTVATSKEVAKKVKNDFEVENSEMLGDVSVLGGAIRNKVKEFRNTVAQKAAERKTQKNAPASPKPNDLSSAEKIVASLPKHLQNKVRKAVTETVEKVIADNAEAIPPANTHNV